LIQSNHFLPPEGFIENRFTYKQQDGYLCFDGDFDNDNDDDDTDVSNASLLPSIIPNTTSTTAASDLLLTLINQVPATSPSPSPVPLTVQPTTVSKTTTSTAPLPSNSPHKKSSTRKELRLQRHQFWAFIQKLHYSRIGCSCSGFQWITAILYKLSMTIWTLWQFHNDGMCLLTSAWQLLLGVLQYIYLAPFLPSPALIVLYLLNSVVAYLEL